MPTITVPLSGLDSALSKVIGDALQALTVAIAEAFVAASARLTEEGTTYWRSIVKHRTGRMAGSLHVVVSGGGLSLIVSFVVGRQGFYYQFQRERNSWNARLSQFLSDRAPAIVAEEIRRRVS